MLSREDNNIASEKVTTAAPQDDESLEEVPALVSAVNAAGQAVIPAAQVETLHEPVVGKRSKEFWRVLVTVSFFADVVYLRWPEVFKANHGGIASTKKGEGARWKRGIPDGGNYGHRNSALAEGEHVVIVEWVVGARTSGSQKGCPGVPKVTLRRVRLDRTTKAALKHKYNDSM